MVNRNKFQILQNKCSTCVKCSLSSTRNNVVFGRGNPHSELFVIGEGPGQQEDEQGLAFVGRAGKMLDSAFLSVGIDTNKEFTLCQGAAEKISSLGMLVAIFSLKSRNFIVTSFHYTRSVLPEGGICLSAIVPDVCWVRQIHFRLGSEIDGVAYLPG